MNKNPINIGKAKEQLKIEKTSLHPRNRNRFRYDFDSLIKKYPALQQFVFTNNYDHETIDFANPNAVKLLNKVLLHEFYNISFWDIPPDYLCPPVPGRADYIHYAADLLGSSNNGTIPHGISISVLDTGVGANCIYPLLGFKEYGWRFVGSEIDPTAALSANNILRSNGFANDKIEIRQQNITTNIFTGIIKRNEIFDLTICNPPFHKSREEAELRTRRKWKNLGFKKEERTVLNFGGQNTEIWCDGGEEQFVQTMIEDSVIFKKSCFWFSTLISKSSNLPLIYKQLKQHNAVDIRTVDMSQGNKISRIVFWTFLQKIEQSDWKEKRWLSYPT